MGIADSIRFYLASQHFAWKSLFAYRFESVIWLIYSTFSEIFALIAITVIYTVSSGIAGWSYYQMLFLSAAATMVLEAIYYNIETGNTVSRLRNGGYDTLFAKPYGLATIMLSTSGGTSEITGFLSGLLVFAYSAIELHLSLESVLVFCVILEVGTVVLLFFVLMLTALTYLLFKSGSFMNNFLGILSTASSYPLNIYGPVFSMLFTVVVPIGVATYYPAGMIFGKISPEAVAMVIAVSALVGITSYKLFYVIMKHYSSGGG